jgi:hypothetical protein
MDYIATRLTPALRRYGTQTWRRELRIFLRGQQTRAVIHFRPFFTDIMSGP